MTTTPLTDQQLADTTSEALGEMHTAVEGIVRLFQQRCPEGFDASDVAAAIVDACSDELGPLYRDRAELGRVRAELATVQARLAAVGGLLPANREDDASASWIPARQLRAAIDPDTGPGGVVHACPPGNSALTPCCGKTPFELARTDRLTYDQAEITCPAAVVPSA